jgi:hypothetical protein
MAHTRCMLNKKGYMRIRTCTRPRARLPTRTQARTHRPINNTYCFCTATLILKRVSKLRYTNTDCFFPTFFSVFPLLLTLFLPSLPSEDISNFHVTIFPFR